ncbi:MAG TPA: hypothetical protein VHO25_18800 [Polyangiaceae bacterium]|nr:hypothetical protein [Polyangiaceae bacterium]
MAVATRDWSADIRRYPLCISKVDRQVVETVTGETYKWIAGATFDHIRLGPTEEDWARFEEERTAAIEVVKRILKGVMPMSVRCKFVCSFKEGQSVHLSPVYSGSEENKKFFQATPGGQIAFDTVNQSALDQFEQGKEYYVDFTPAEKASQ